MERMVILKSMVNGTVSVNYPQYAINRRWSKLGQPIAIPYSLVEQCLYENGFRRMIDSGILYIENMQDKIDLGLEPYGATEPVNIIALNEKEIEALLNEKDINVFKKKILQLPRVQVDNIIEYAIKNEKVDMNKVSFLKELTGKDILSSITRKREMAELERKEAEAAKRRKEEEGRR